MRRMYSNLKHLPIYLLIMMTMGISGLEKLFGLEIPEWYMSQFAGSAIDIFPGVLSLMWVLITVLQLTTFVITLMAIIKSEFRDGVSKAFTRPAFLLTEITFIILGFGQRVTQQFDASFWLFAYAVLTYLAARSILKDSDHSLQTI